jgi:hypothetical protein
MPILLQGLWFLIHLASCKYRWISPTAAKGVVKLRTCSLNPVLYSPVGMLVQSAQQLDDPVFSPTNLEFWQVDVVRSRAVVAERVSFTNDASV